MPEPIAPADPTDSDSTAGLAPIFVAIVVIEALTVIALGWFGSHFS